MEKEVELLSRVTVNHLILGQYEPFRASVLSLQKRNPTLALSILQTIIARGGRIEEILWSPSCPSPSNLAWLASLELLNFSRSPSSIWNIDPDTLRSKVEFLLLLQLVSSRLSHPDSVNIVNRFLDFGLKRLKADIVDDDDSAPRDLVSLFTEDELQCLEKLVVDHPEIFYALNWNIQKQVKWSHTFDSRLAITLSPEDQETKGSFEDNLEVLLWMQRSIQKGHINALRKCLEMNDDQGAVSHLMFLHMDYGAEESMYRIALQDCIRKACSRRNGFGDTWHSMRNKMLLIYAKAVASNSIELVQMIQVLDDQLLSEEIELHRVSDAHTIPPPLRRLQEYLQTSDSAVKGKLDDGTSPYYLVIKCCLRDMFHYARVTGVHILECVMDAALSAVKREELQEASNFLSLFPHLRPLVAVMGWDLLSGKTVLRRKLMQLLWTSKSQVLRLEDSSIYGKQSDEVSCVEHLCDLLCYRFDIASFVACANSGQSWNSKFSLLFSQGESTIKDNQMEHSDPFVENFVLERLAVQNPMRVLFDVVPGIKFRDAIELVSMQPIASKTAAWKRKQDIELMHMRYALEAVVLALGATARNSTHENENNQNLGGSYLKDLQNHLEAISSIPRKTFMLNIIIALLYMDDITVSLTHCTPSTCNKSFSGTSSEGEGETVVSFMAQLLNILHHNLPTAGPELDKAMDSIIFYGRQALEWRISNAKLFIEDWEWRLSVLQRLLPLSARNWSWKEALAILRAAPSKLLDVCMQRAKYDIGEEAVHRFSLPPEDRAALELAEWVDSAFQKASVEDAVSRVAEGTPNAVLELDFSSFRAQLGSLPTILLCIDVAATSARSVHMCKQLLEQARVMLSEIYPGVSPKIGETYWDQIQEVSLISVIKRILQCLQEFLEQENPATLQAILSGKINYSHLKEPNRQSQRQRALSILHQMIEDAHQGKRQFLSGKLHNLARALADEEMDVSFIREESMFTDKKVLPSSGKGGIFGLGFKPRRRTSVSSIRENNAETSAYDVKDSAERLLAPISTKASTYLSAFILYIATIGDLVDGTDTTHDFNFFSVVYEWPKDLLTRLVFERGSTDAAGKVADIMSVDFVHEVVSACVPPVYPPRTGHGWASIPIQPPFLKTSVNNNLHSPKENKLTQYSDSSQTSKPPLYPLQLNVVRHLAKLSPVRAVLACVFGTSILASSNEWSLFKASNDATGQATDSDRLFYEFALDQSERFPTLNRWIQMQSNLHRVSATTLTSKDKNADDVAKPNGKLSVKRVRESDSDTESEVDDLAVNGHVSSSQLELNTQSHGDSEARHDSSKPGTVEHDQTIYLSFDWENEGPYEMAVERLINEGKLMDALALSDRCLRNGASDQLLQLLIEHGEENKSISNEGYGTNNLWTESWRLVQRLKDKQLASRLALKYLHRWDLEAATEVLTMCGCHLLENDPLKNEVLQRRQALLRYNHILCADDHCKSWQEVETECKEDPEGLALRLAGKGAVSAALEVAESAGLSIDLRRELQGRQLVKLLMTDPLSGGGPAEASRFLSSLRDTDDALPVAVSAMQLLSDLRSKQLLVHFFLKRRAGNLTDAEVSRLNKWALGLRVLGVLPLPWQQRCSALHERPHLILEVLLMRKQLQSASLVLKEFPSLRDNNLILTYAAKSITVSATSMPREQRRAVPGPRPKQKAKTGTPTRLNFTASLSNLQREARRAFSWAPRDTGNKIAPKEAYRKRKSSGLTPSEKVAWEAMTGIQEERISVCSADGQERIPSLSIAEEWMLTGDSVKDNSVRSCHRYESSPDIILFKVLLSLCSDESVSAKGALDLCISQMKNILSAQQLPLHASLETLGRACHATETFVQGLQYAKSLLRKVGGNSNSTSSSDKSKDTDEASSDAGSSSIGSCSQYSDELHELFSQVEIWLGRAELLQSLLGSGIVASIDDIGDKESSARLRDRLIEDERYSMAVYTCKKCKIDAFPVWNAWGHALLRMEHYAQARVKFKQALQLYKGDFTPIIMEIINTIEGSPPVDVDAVRSMCEDLAKSAPRILDDSLSADAYLNVLYVPSTYPRSEPSGQSRSATNFQSASYLDFDVGPRSNLDNIRYTECVTYLQDFARQQVLGFMFRHGHYSDACMLFFPSSGAPSSPQPSSLGAVTPSPSPQRSDPLTTDYGTIDDLCEHCIGYGAVSVLENVISSRLASQDPIVIQYTTSALARICNYCETHRHFNHLYKFQVIKKDHVAAGLCCIQLFMNSSSQEEAIKHLELAKMHFEEGLSARHKAGDTMKLSSKSIRGKRASEKLTEEGLMKFSARVAIQVEVVKSFHDTDGPQWKHSLFGNPSDPDTFRRRCEVAETLAEKNFDLAFQVIYEFNLPAVDIYAGVAASLAERKKGGQLTEFFRNIKGTIDDDDWDQVLGAAINVYANRHKERPDRLIDMLISSHRKVLACVVCGRLKSAFQIASRSGSVADVQYVAHQALHANALPVLDMCKQWLAQFM